MFTTILIITGAISVVTVFFTVYKVVLALMSFDKNNKNE